MSVKDTATDSLLQRCIHYRKIPQASSVNCYIVINCRRIFFIFLQSTVGTGCRDCSPRNCLHRLVYQQPQADGPDYLRNFRFIIRTEFIEAAKSPACTTLGVPHLVYHTWSGNSLQNVITPGSEKMRNYLAHHGNTPVGRAGSSVTHFS